jgi:hypothetical protein
MTQLRLNHIVLRPVVWTALLQVIACSMSGFAAAQTASSYANQRRALFTQNVASTANVPDPSSLGAISAMVDTAVDRRVHADMQKDLSDPSLSPLRIIAPNVNGEDESSAQTQPRTPTPSNGGRDKHFGITANSISTSEWSPGRTGRRQDAPVLRGPSPLHTSRQYRRPIRSSGRDALTDNTSPVSIPISVAETDLRPTRGQTSHLTGLRKTRAQQKPCRSEGCHLYLSESERRAELKQQSFSIGLDPSPSFTLSLAAIR